MPADTPTMQTPDPVAVAGGLSEAQRELLRLAATNDHVVTYDYLGVYTGGLCRCLKPFDHGKNNKTAAFKITPFGLAVRRVIEGGGGDVRRRI